MKKTTCDVLHNKLIMLSYFVIDGGGKKSVGVKFIDIKINAEMGCDNGFNQSQLRFSCGALDYLMLTWFESVIVK